MTVELVSTSPWFVRPRDEGQIVVRFLAIGRRPNGRYCLARARYDQSDQSLVIESARGRYATESAAYSAWRRAIV